METIKRLRFHIHRFYKKLMEKMIGHEKLEKELDEVKVLELTPQERSAMDELLNAPGAGDPEIDPRRTILFISKQGKFGCNSFTAPVFKKRIVGAVFWAKEQGIDTFIADYTTPFGLLAFETLLKMREAGEEFHLYSLMGNHISDRKSWRLIPETPIELAILLSQADYNFNLPPDVVATNEPKCVMEKLD